MADSASAERLDSPDLLVAVERNLQAALAADEPVEKNYFIRTALQFAEIHSD